MFMLIVLPPSLIQPLPLFTNKSITKIRMFIIPFQKHFVNLNYAVSSPDLHNN